MLVPKTTRVAVYSKLFDDGVMVVEKNPFAKKHMELDVPNLHAMKLCQSLESREYVKGSFNWNHHYYFLTDAGIKYLRGYLNIPSNTIPKTHVKPRPPPASGPRGAGEGPGGEKKMGPGGDFRPEYKRDEYRSAPPADGAGGAGYGGLGRGQ
mmetsp:Transcript_13650/g.36651  ORF Transcript_13650/g.36651 Transcript_13650/m.36651 type:complete len:152 (+) Transcript_13650:53-508(+)